MPSNLSFEEKLKAASEAHFDYMELSIDETDEKLARLDWSSTEINNLRRAIEETSVPIFSICLSGHRRFPLGDEDNQKRERGLEMMKKSCALAAALGVRIIQIAGYDVYYSASTEKTRERFSEYLFRSVEIASSFGVTLAFETMETPFINTTEKAMYWVQNINSPWLQVYPDTGNITNAAKADSNNVIADLETARGHISALHLKESKPGIFREVPYGTGHVDFSSICTKACDLGVRLFVGEFWHKGEEHWRNILSDNALFLRGYLDRAFEKNS
jgi:predicted hexulose-6-phosphate isomerase